MISSHINKDSQKCQENTFGRLLFELDKMHTRILQFGHFTDMKRISAAYRIFKSGVKP